MTDFIDRVRVRLVREECTEYRAQITNANHARDIAREFLMDSDREELLVLLLNQKHQIESVSTVAIGTVNASIVHPREVFKPAILANATCIILAHNHPSGDVNPSNEDMEVTKQIKEAGNLLGIPMLDHLIIGSTGEYYSFSEHGLC